MSLDKWLGKEDEKEEKEVESREDKQEKVKEGIDQQEKTLIPQKKETQRGKMHKEEKKTKKPKLTKYMLTCSDSNCKYKKTLMKRELTREDKVCPRCKSDMNVKKA